MEFCRVETDVLCLLEAGGLQQAEEKLLPFCIPSVNNSRACFLLGVVKHRLGELEAALHFFERAVQLDPLDAEFRSAAGAVLADLGRHHDALRVFRKALRRDPANPQLLVNIAVALEFLGDRIGALEHYDRALALDARCKPALLNRGGVLAELGRLDTALANNDVLARCYPDWSEAHFCRAEVLLALGRYGEAFEACEQALRLDPAHVKALFDRAVILSVRGEFAAAEAAFESLRLANGAAYEECLGRASRLAGFEADLSVPIPELIYLVGMSRRQEECNWEGRGDYVRRFQEWIDRNEPFMAEQMLPFHAFALPLGARRQCELSRMASSRLARVAGMPLPVPTQRSHTKIRLGYVSPDFRVHPVGRLSRQLYHFHDREQFEVYAYSLLPDDGSALHRDIRGACDRFFDVGGLGTRELAERIRSDEIDILVDLAGHTRKNRLDVFALRPAPVQVTYLGFPCTTGADFMDYLVTDVVSSPPGSEAWYSECLAYLPRASLMYDNEQAVASFPSRLEAGLPETGAVFCCFNNTYKIEPDIFSCWMRILDRVPGSVLWLFKTSEGFERNLRREAERQGIDSRRLVFAPFFADLMKHLARYGSSDLFLDTLGLNAHTTAMDALWAGLPVLTCPGDGQWSRGAASLLASIGMPELAVGDMGAYEEAAVRLGSHPGEVAALKAKLKTNRQTWPLFDTRGYVRYLEQAYQTMWQRCLAGLPPESFKVPA